MAINYSFSVSGKFLRVTATGKDESLEEVENYGMAIIKAAVSSACTSILCDERKLIYNLGTIDTFESAKFISENAPKVAKVAVVCRAQDYSDAVFWETVAVNRGLQVKMFKKVDDAEQWLKQ